MSSVSKAGLTQNELTKARADERSDETVARQEKVDKRTAHGIQRSSERDMSILREISIAEKETWDHLLNFVQSKLEISAKLRTRRVKLKHFLTVQSSFCGLGIFDKQTPKKY